MAERTAGDVARKPEEIHALFEKRFKEGDLEGILSLYEPGAILVLQGQVLRNREEISEAIDELLSMRPRYTQMFEHAVEAGGLALLSTRWSMEGKGPDGKAFADSGRTADVARRQPDGSWLLAIDSPYAGGGE